MENSNSSNENDFVDFFKGLDESYQRYLISEIQKKPPDIKLESAQADIARLAGDPESR